MVVYILIAAIFISRETLFYFFFFFKRYWFVKWQIIKISKALPRLRFLTMLKVNTSNNELNVVFCVSYGSHSIEPAGVQAMFGQRSQI